MKTNVNDGSSEKGKRWIWIAVAPVAIAGMMLATSRAQQTPPPPGENPPAASRPAGDERGPREGAREGPHEGPRDGGPREGGPREDGPREDGPREDGPREDGPREDGPREDDREGRPGHFGGPRPDGFAGPGGPGGPMARGGPDGRGPEGRGPDGRGPDGHGGPGMRRPPSVDTMRNYLELVDRYSAMSQDANKAGVAAVLTAADLLRAQGNDAAIKYFTDVLSDESSGSSPEVRRAIRLQLAELYKAANQSDKALEQLKAVMQGK